MKLEHYTLVNLEGILHIKNGKNVFVSKDIWFILIGNIQNISDGERVKIQGLPVFGINSHNELYINQISKFNL